MILVVVLLLANGLGDGGGGGTSSNAFDGAGELATNCQTGADANQRTDCLVTGVVNSVQEYWSGAVQGYTAGADRPVRRPGVDRLRPGRLVRSAPSTARATGRCTSTSGSTTICAPGSAPQGGRFAEAYVLAHEYGHHVQDLLGTNDRVGDDREGPASASVRLELQADCFAGVWAAHAVDTALIAEITPADISDGLDAAAAVGDDRIQRAATGSGRPRVVDPRLVEPAPTLVLDGATTPATRTAATHSPPTRSES